MDEALKILATSGVAGAVLAFMLLKVQPALERIAQEMRDNLAKYQQEHAARLDRLESALHERQTRLESRQDELEQDMKYITTENLLRLVASPHVADSLKDAATKQIETNDPKGFEKATSAGKLKRQ